jgi:hypothetical protein
MGGAGAPPVVTQGGFRTPLPTFPAGGTPAVTQGGVRSMLAFWAGGANAGLAPVIDEQILGGPSDRLDIIEQEDDEIMIIINAFLHMVNR